MDYKMILLNISPNDAEDPDFMENWQSSSALTKSPQPFPYSN